MMQDSLNDAGGGGEAHDPEGRGTTATEHRIGFIHALDQPLPGALATTGASVLSIKGNKLWRPAPDVLVTDATGIAFDV